jgi:hypothetical protein
MTVPARTLYAPRVQYQANLRDFRFPLKQKGSCDVDATPRSCDSHRSTSMAFLKDKVSTRKRVTFAGLRSGTMSYWNA